MSHSYNPSDAYRAIPALTIIRDGKRNIMTQGSGLLVDPPAPAILPPLRPVSYQEGGIEFEGYLATPTGSGPHSCVILGHDWSGPNISTQTIARRLAYLGYAAFLLDSYGKGVRGDETGDNSHLMNPVMADRAMLTRRIRAGYESARNLPEVDENRMSALGFCFGGFCVLDLARTDPDGLKVTISVHGGLTPPNDNPPAPIRSRIVILHGWEDPVAPPQDVTALARELTLAGADWELNAYGHAMHAFTFPAANMPERGIDYHPAAALRAEAAILRELAAARKPMS